MPEKAISFGAIDAILNKTRKAKRQPPKPEYTPPKNRSTHTIENPKLKKVCSECHETKQIHLFNVSGTGKRHKAYCKKCEALLINPKKMGIAIKNEKEETPKQEIKEVKEKPKQKEKDKMAAPKQIEGCKSLPKQKKSELQNVFTATDYFMHVVVPHTLKNKNCFTIAEIRESFKLEMDAGKAYHKVYKILMELVKLDYLKYAKVAGSANKYYIPGAEVSKLLKEKNITQKQAKQLKPGIEKPVIKKEEEEPAFIKNKMKPKKKKKPTKVDLTRQLSVVYNRKVIDEMEAIAEERHINLSKLMRMAVMDFLENQGKTRFKDGLIELMARFAKVIEIKVNENGMKTVIVECKTSIDMFELYNLLPPKQQKTVRNLPRKNEIEFEWG